MTAGAEVVCNDVVRKVETEEKCVAGLNMSDLNDVGAVDGNVGGNRNGNVGGDGKEDTEDSSYVFVSGSIEVSAGDPGDTEGVNVDDSAPKSDSADEVDQLHKEELGTENGGIPVDPLVSETNGIVLGSITVIDTEVKAVTDDVHLENGSTVDPPVVLTNTIAHDVNGHLDEISGEEEADVKNTEELNDANEITNIEAKSDDTVSGVTFDPESTLNTLESSQVTVSGSESTIKLSDVTVTQSLSTPDVINTTDKSLSTPYTVNNTDCEVMINDEPKHISTLVDKAECQVTVDGSGEPSEDLECQVTFDGSESSGSLIEEQSVKPSEDLGSQVTADEAESCESPIKEQECKVSDSIDSLVDNQECPVSVDESEPSGNHNKDEESSSMVMEPDGKSEEHHELLVISSEVNVVAEPNHVCSGIKVEHQSDSVSEENRDSGFLLSEEAETEADGSVLLLINAEKAKSEENLDNQVVESSETVVEVTDSVEMEANSEKMKELVKTEDEIQESQIVVEDNVQDELKLKDNTAESVSEAEVPLETETNIEPYVHENTTSQYEVSKLGGSVENVETIDTEKSECAKDELLVVKDHDSVSNPDELTVVERKVEIVAHLDTENKSAEGMNCKFEIENVGVSDDDEKETEVKDAPVEDVPHLVPDNTSAKDVDCGTGNENVEFPNDEEKETEVKDAHVEIVPPLVTENISNKGMDSGTGNENVNIPDDEEKETEVKDASVGDNPTLSFPEKVVNLGAVIEFGSIGHHDSISNIQNEEVEYMNGIEIPTSSVEGSPNDDIDIQNEEAEVLDYNFLIRIPRFEDENFKDQIRNAQLLVEEKTRLRDAIRVEIHGKRARLKAHNEAYNAAKMEETAARRLVRLKRQEIDSVQVVINRLKNAMSVEDIDNRILNMEHMIQHETLLLKDEKQFIREIKQLKTLRDQLASNMGTPEEIRQAIDQKDQNEERMKTLRKELDSLKEKVSKAEAVVKTVGRKYDEESRKERELQAQFRAADDVRQKAYAHLNSLKKLSYDKNKNFRQFKEDLMAARDFASRRDKDAIHRLCTNQVETFMEQWNNNDEFRKEYISRCNMNASRRQRVLDGGPLVPDDVAPVLPSNVNEKIDKSLVSIPGEAKSVSVELPVEQGKIVSSTENKHADNTDNNNNNINNNNKSIENISGQKHQTLKTKGVAKPTNLRSDNMAKEETELAVVAEVEENKLTKEEIELAKKAEELRKEEIAAKLKEQRRLEEKAKAVEALERKKRNAEKAQMRAEIRARKEAEQKEKEREKRLRKKEKKKTGGGDGSINGEEAASSESSNEATTKEIETVINKKKTQKPPAHFFSKQLKPKPIPPPLINRNKKRWEQWGKLALTVVGILLLFLLGNSAYFFNFKASKFNGFI